MRERKEITSRRVLLEDVRFSLTTETWLSTLYRLQHFVKLSRITEVSEKLSTIKATPSQGEYNSSEVQLKNVNARYSVSFSILYYMDIKHEMGCSVSVLARLLPGLPANRGYIFSKAATFLCHTQNKL